MYKRKSIVHDEIRRKREWLTKYKEENPCSDCGRCYPHFVMEFDHRDPKQKSFALSMNCVQRKWMAILQEMDKCDLVCGNCHRIRTHKREGWGKNFQ